MKLSGIVIAKDAEEVIKECLESLSFCDEVIVVDAGSIDATVAIAKKYGAQVIQGTQKNFAKQREIGLKHAKGDWILYIDTDERVGDELKENIQSVILRANGVRTPESNLEVDSGQTRMPTSSAFRIKRKNFYLGNHPWPTVERLERLFKISSLKGWRGALHETPIFEGEIGELEGYVLHYTHRNLESMLGKTIEWSEIEAKLRLDSNHPQVVWWRLIRVMLTGFYNSYIQQHGWKAGTAGLVESMYQAYSMFVTYARLWEMQKIKK